MNLVSERDEKELLECGVLEILYIVEIQSLAQLGTEIQRILEGGHEYFGMWDGVLRVYRECDLHDRLDEDYNRT
jgi:hypothetical protein